MNRWEHAVAGEGQVVLIVADPGIGKSRLLQRFREQIADHPLTWLESGAVPFLQNTPFHAVTDMLEQSFHWESGDSAEQKLAALEASLTRVQLKEAMPLLAPLLELALDTPYDASSLLPEQRRKRLLAALVEWIVAKTHPLVIATKDLHWADASTLELIQLLVEQGRRNGCCFCASPGPSFTANGRYEHITRKSRSIG
jgi:predicted ATPase